jgi:hypothetical protein
MTILAGNLKIANEKDKKAMFKLFFRVVEVLLGGGSWRDGGEP